MLRRVSPVASVELRVVLVVVAAPPAQPDRAATQQASHQAGLAGQLGEPSASSGAAVPSAASATGGGPDPTGTPVAVLVDLI
jgi:hypothetical protein